MALRELEDSIRQLFSRLGAVERSSSPAGNITATARATAPSGYLICDGAAVSRTEYANLFAAIGTAYGVGDGSTTFGLPNLKGRVIVGVDAAQAEFNVLGEVGGAKTHTLNTGEMPAHTHVQDAHNHTQNSHNHTQNSHTHPTKINSSVAFGAGTGSTSLVVNDAGTTATSATTATNQATTATNIAATATNQNTGGGGAHNNLQPYMALHYLIKT